MGNLAFQVGSTGFIWTSGLGTRNAPKPLDMCKMVIVPYVGCRYGTDYGFDLGGPLPGFLGLGILVSV